MKEGSTRGEAMQAGHVSLNKYRRSTKVYQPGDKSSEDTSERDYATDMEDSTIADTTERAQLPTNTTYDDLMAIINR
jgi:hypothetical protein